MEQASRKAMVCPQCGKGSEPGLIFCPNCSAALHVDVAEPEAGTGERSSAARLRTLYATWSYERLEHALLEEWDEFTPEALALLKAEFSTRQKPPEIAETDVASNPFSDRRSRSRMLWLSFDRRLREQTPVPRFTYGLIGINIFLFVVTVVLNDRFRLLDPGTWYPVDNLRLWFGCSGERVLEGEWWRVFTAGVLHSGPAHLLTNMSFLWYFGRQLERMLGGVRFLALYFVCDLAGAVAEIGLSPLASSVGASGAISGVVGALFTAFATQKAVPLGVVVRNRKLLVLLYLLFFADITLGLGPQHWHEFNWAHAGGMFAGLLLGCSTRTALNREGSELRSRTSRLLRGNGALAGIAFCCVAGIVIIQYSYVGELHAARRIIAAGDVQEGIRRLQRIAAGHRNVDVQYVLAGAYLDRAHQPLKALEESQNCLRLAPYDPDCRRILGEAYLALDRPDDAIRELMELATSESKSALLVMPLSEAYSAKAKNELEASHYEQAIDAARLALKVNPMEVRAHLIIARASLLEGDLDAARFALLELERVSPHNSEAEQISKLLKARSNPNPDSARGGNSLPKRLD